MNDNELAKKAYLELLNKEPNRAIQVKYSGRFKSYNANITATRTTLLFKLAKEFKEVDDTLKIGVMQYLLTKLYKTKTTTLEIELYHKFIKYLGELSAGGEGTTQDQELKESFDRVNKAYLHDYMLMPHLKWGTYSTTRLGYYTFIDDTITLSTVLRGADELLDYVMYHELLHKKHKYEHRGGRTHSHTKAFREDERKFRLRSGEDPEEALTRYLKTQPRNTTKKRKTIARGARPKPKTHPSQKTKQKKRKPFKKFIEKLTDFF